MNTTYEAELKVSIQKAAREAHKEGFTPTHVAMTSKTIKDMRYHLDKFDGRLQVRYWYERANLRPSGMLEVVEDERLEAGEAKVCTRESAFVLGYVDEIGEV